MAVLAPALQTPLRSPETRLQRGVLVFMVGTVGFEPTTPSVSRKCSPPELSAHDCDLRSVGYCTDPSRGAPVPEMAPLRAPSAPCATAWASLSYPLRFGACGRGSVGRAQPCQGWGRRFESGRPLHRSPADGRDRSALSPRIRLSSWRKAPTNGAPAWRCSQVARQRPAKPLSPVRIRASPPSVARRACQRRRWQALSVHVGVARYSSQRRNRWCSTPIWSSTLPTTKSTRSSMLCGLW
jgi:hypothetical protein